MIHQHAKEICFAGSSSPVHPSSCTGESAVEVFRRGLVQPGTDHHLQEANDTAEWWRYCWGRQNGEHYKSKCQRKGTQNIESINDLLKLPTTDKGLGKICNKFSRTMSL